MCGILGWREGPCDCCDPKELERIRKQAELNEQQNLRELKIKQKLERVKLIESYNALKEENKITKQYADIWIDNQIRKLQEYDNS